MAAERFARWLGREPPPRWRRLSPPAHAGVPVVPQGGRTGLTGGATAMTGRPASLERMTGIEEIDPASHPDRAGRHAAAGHSGGGRAGRAALRLGPRRARVVSDWRQRGDQRRRQPRHSLRHDARPRARSRGGARRRHGAHVAQQAHQEQRRLRPAADLHRVRRHARRHHARRRCGSTRARAASRRRSCARRRLRRRARASCAGRGNRSARRCRPSR